MADTAEFVVKLKDKVSAPAKKSSRSLSEMRGEATRAAEAMRKLQRQTDKAGKAGAATTKIGGLTVAQRIAANRKATQQRLRAEAKIEREKKAAAKRAHIQAMRLAKVEEKKRLAMLKRESRAREARMRTLKGLGIGLAVAAGAAAVAFGIFATHAFKAGLDVEKSVNALNRLDKGAGQQSFNEVAGLAASLGLNVSDTVHQYEKLRKLQFKPEDARGLIKMGADMQALGNSAEDVQGILLAMSQIKSKGKLQGEEMLQLAERGVSGVLVKEEIAKIMGVDPGSIEDLQRRGAVGADVALQAIENAINRKLKQSKVGESAEQFATQTTTGMLNVFKSRGQLITMGLGDEMRKGLERSGGLKDLGGLFKSSGGIKFLKSLGAGFKTIGKIIGKLIPVAVEAVTVFGGAFVEALGGVMGGADGAGTSATKFAMLLKTHIIPAARVVGQILGFVTGIVIDLGAMFIAGSAIIGHAIDVIVQRIMGMPAFFAALPGRLFSVGQEIVNGLWSGITASWRWMMGQFEGLIELLPAAAKKALGIASPSKEFAYLGRMSGEGFQKGLDGAAPTIDAVVPAGNSGKLASRAGQAAGARSAGNVSVGGIKIEVSGAGDPEATGNAVMAAFETRLASTLGHYAGEVA